MGGFFFFIEVKNDITANMIREIIKEINSIRNEFVSEEELQNPRLTIENFFECYHLQEVRQILWNWMVEVVSSSRSISQEG
jgi:hypothetical protein